MNHWLIALPPEDMEHCIKIGVFGRAMKGAMGKVKTGDKVVCYVTKEGKIVAFGEATSEYYMDDEPIFKAEGVFPDRFKFKATLLKPDRKIPIRSVVDDLSFITNKIYWSVFLRAVLVRIPEKDWKLLHEKAR